VSRSFSRDIGCSSSLVTTRAAQGYSQSFSRLFNSRFGSHKSHPGSSGLVVHSATSEPAPRPGLGIEIRTSLFNNAKSAATGAHEDITAFVQHLLGKCVPCWARGYSTWNTHNSETCPDPVANSRDSDWVSWDKRIKVNGHCWECCRSQVLYLLYFVLDMHKLILL
jgi:hypothetical protein